MSVVTGGHGGAGGAGGARSPHRPATITPLAQPPPPAPDAPKEGLVVLHIEPRLHEPLLDLSVKRPRADPYPHHAKPVSGRELSAWTEKKKRTTFEQIKFAILKFVNAVKTLSLL